MELVPRDCVGSNKHVRNSEIRKIVVTVSAPTELSIEDRTLAAPFMTSPSYLSKDGRKRREILDRKLEGVRESMSVKLTDELHIKLKAAGFGTSSTTREMGSPTLDLSALPAGYAALDVSFTEVGLSSLIWSNGYEPRVNVRACLFDPSDASDWLTSDHFFYGADSSGDGPCSIPVPNYPNHRYQDLDALVDSAEEMSDVFEGAIQAIAERISRRLVSQCGSGAPVSPNDR